MNINEFKENLGLTTIPVELEKLIHFQENISGFENYSEGFGVLIDDKSALKSWGNDNDFLDNVLQFAQANGSGSFYAIWNDGTKKTLNEMPVIVFGDEGGVHVVAKNLLELLQLLSFDSEISVDFDEAYFYKDEEDYEESEDLTAYLKWLKEEFGLDQIKTPDEIVKAAQATYKKDFDNWLAQYHTST